MIQSLPSTITVDQFLDWYPTNSTQFRYELHNGFIKRMPPPTGDHELLLAFLIKQILLECARLSKPYDIPKMGFVQSSESESAFLPDVLLLNRLNLVNEPLWRNKSTVSQPSSIPLVIEVVSTNWRDDYFTQLGQYEAIGIPEYWIVDYAALGGRKFIGNPKQPTISIYLLVEGEYQVKQFRNTDYIESLTFPDLVLTAEQIFQSAIPLT
ncbi:Uma2 family endonuclease [Aetokthonos hydrillicola Thurmond2011]|jgi:Uma2 family endonuclease|uniref:Uma2 family endonuclease n=1 Tax=Aetokthonos hydrillicola Thurmond2011 TaxID=2712845 RepID=A0AAP5I603_9CYAN|nr:Uma2 family endonuclease [Aetokthonos hydrillicola]MBW4587767.1 Uma2 family endonuclease [Aetokthonos hydrillicola CCALA 1050]MDR9894414.1 Uma2 family endonuclease [Aetokthonos hydrillicola Thurmond2011]